MKIGIPFRRKQRSSVADYIRERKAVIQYYKNLKQLEVNKILAKKISWHFFVIYYHLNMIDYVQQRKDFDAQVQDDSKAIGFAINLGPVETKTRFYKWKYDESVNCRMVLCRFLGSAMWFRYPVYLIKFNGETPAYF